MIPSLSESTTALQQARQALDHHREFWYGNAGKLEVEFYELDLFATTERVDAVDIALGEIGPSDRQGPPPPDNMIASGVNQGRKLFAFCWQSQHFKTRMYLKFAIVSGIGRGAVAKPRLLLFSLHETRNL